jgi:hypothetical protein
MGDLSAGAAVAVGLGSALLGALITGLFQVMMWSSDRAARRRIAARSVIGDIYVTEAAFKLLLERDEWFSFDFGPMLGTWVDHRDDLARAVSMADWAEVDAFYSNLARTSALAKPFEKPTDGDRTAAEAQVAYAERAQKVVARQVTRWGLRGWRERRQVIKRLSSQEAGAVAEVKTDDD